MTPDNIAIRSKQVERIAKDASYLAHHISKRNGGDASLMGIAKYLGLDRHSEGPFIAWEVAGEPATVEAAAAIEAQRKLPAGLLTGLLAGGGEGGGGDSDE